MNAEGLSFCTCSDCWVLNSLKLVLLGLKEPNIFLQECLDTIRDVETCKKMGKVYTLAVKIAEKREQRKNPFLAKRDNSPDFLARKKMSRMLNEGDISRKLIEGERLSYL